VDDPKQHGIDQTGTGDVMSGAGTVYSWNDRVLDQRVAALGAESEIIVSRIIQKLNGGSINAVTEYEAMVTDGALPIVDYDAYGALGSWHQFCRARSVTVRLLEGGKAVDAQISFRTKYIISPCSTTTPITMLPAQFSFVTASRNLKLHRMSWATSPPTTSTNSTGDIGGTSVTGADGFESVQIGQVRIRLRATQDASVVPLDTAATTLTNYANTTNNATFCGFPAYSLICEGVNLEKEQGSEFYEVVFEFLYDKFFHFSQVATIDADGRPKMTTSGQLSEVKWMRLPRTATDFNNIYDGDTALKSYVEDGWWVCGT
jgi:hypothetical protein